MVWELLVLINMFFNKANACSHRRILERTSGPSAALLSIWLRVANELWLVRQLTSFGTVKANFVIACVHQLISMGETVSQRVQDDLVSVYVAAPKKKKKKKSCLPVNIQPLSHVHSKCTCCSFIVLGRPPPVHISLSNFLHMVMFLKIHFWCAMVSRLNGAGKNVPTHFIYLFVYVIH